ncbi:MAG: hypothetical protein AB7S26_00240 [Sandaracinaceae bacterium]
MRRASIALVVLAAMGCAQPTALLVFIDSDMDLDRVEVTVTGREGVPAAESISETWTSDTYRPLHLTLIPDTTHDVGVDDVDVEVVGFLDATATPAIRRRARTRFVDGETRYVQMYLWAVCEIDPSDPCPDPGETCVADEMSTTPDCQTIEAVAATPYGDEPPPVCDLLDVECP